jgi:hypothetical protein
MVMNKSLLLAVLAVIVVVATAYEFPVNVYLMGESHAQYRIARHVFANPVGQPGLIVHPTFNGTVQHPTAVFNLTHGDWEFSINETGYYSYKDIFHINSSTSAAGGNMFLLPISAGVTIFTHPYVNSGLMWANVTVPAGAFNFGEHISARLPGQIWNFGNNTPPAQLSAFPYRMYLSSAQNGTYRYYQEVISAHENGTLLLSSNDNQNGTLLSATQNFTNNVVKVSIFSGPSQNGFIGTFKSSFQNASAWYVGDLIVEKPNNHCSVYRWQTVNTYSAHGAGFNKTNHGNGVVIFEECSSAIISNTSCHEVLVNETGPSRTCGAFGDPHVITFNGTGVTCGNEALMTLVDNKYFSLKADTQRLNDSNGATSISSVTFTYKTLCNPITLTFNNSAELNSSLINAPLAYRHHVRVERNNIFLDALHVKIQVRQVQGTVVFGVSMPESLIIGSTGICADSCPSGKAIDLASTLKRWHRFSALAATACNDAGLSRSSFEYQACLFDVATSGNAAFAATAKAITAVRSEVAASWNAPFQAPIPISDKPIYSDASGQVPSAIFAALLAIIALFF